MLPRLALFCPVEKVLRSDEGAASLISILENLNISVSEAAGAPPPDAVFPTAWALFSLWERSDSQEPETFEQLVQGFHSGSTSASFRSEIQFTFSAGLKRIQVHQAAFGFPVGQGELTFVASIRELGQTEWEEAGHFAVVITHEVVPAPASPEVPA